MRLSGRFLFLHIQEHIQKYLLECAAEQMFKQSAGLISDLCLVLLGSYS